MYIIIFNLVDDAISVCCIFFFFLLNACWLVTGALSVWLTFAFAANHGSETFTSLFCDISVLG